VYIILDKEKHRQKEKTTPKEHFIVAFREHCPKSSKSQDKDGKLPLYLIIKKMCIPDVILHLI